MRQDLKIILKWQLKQASKYEKAYCQKADHVIAVNSKDERLLHEYYDLNNVELMNPYYGVDFDKNPILKSSLNLFVSLDKWHVKKIIWQLCA